MQQAIPSIKLQDLPTLSAVHAGEATGLIVDCMDRELARTGLPSIASIQSQAESVLPQARRQLESLVDIKAHPKDIRHAEMHLDSVTRTANSLLDISDAIKREIAEQVNLRAEICVNSATRLNDLTIGQRIEFKRIGSKLIRGEVPETLTVHEWMGLALEHASSLLIDKELLDSSLPGMVTERGDHLIFSLWNSIHPPEQIERLVRDALRILNKPIDTGRQVEPLRLDIYEEIDVVQGQLIHPETPISLLTERAIKAVSLEFPECDWPTVRQSSEAAPINKALNDYRMVDVIWAVSRAGVSRKEINRRIEDSFIMVSYPWAEVGEARNAERAALLAPETGLDKKRLARTPLGLQPYAQTDALRIFQDEPFGEALEKVTMRSEAIGEGALVLDRTIATQSPEIRAAYSKVIERHPLGLELKAHDGECAGDWLGRIVETAETYYGTGRTSSLQILFGWFAITGVKEAYVNGQNHEITKAHKALEAYNPGQPLGLSLAQAMLLAGVPAEVCTALTGWNEEEGEWQPPKATSVPTGAPVWQTKPHEFILLRKVVNAGEWFDAQPSLAEFPAKHLQAGKSHVSDGVVYINPRDSESAIVEVLDLLQWALPEQHPWFAVNNFAEYLTSIQQALTETAKKYGAKYRHAAHALLVRLFAEPSEEELPPPGHWRNIELPPMPSKSADSTRKLAYVTKVEAAGIREVYSFADKKVQKIAIDPTKPISTVRVHEGVAHITIGQDRLRAGGLAGQMVDDILVLKEAEKKYAN